MLLKIVQKTAVFTVVLLMSLQLPCIASDAVTSTAAASQSVTQPDDAAFHSPEGYWLVYTKDGKTKRSVVKISIGDDGSLSARFVAIFYVPGHVWGEMCTDCVQQFHGQPLQGMAFLWGLKHQSDSWDAPWVGGKVFNPDSNHVYRASIQLTDKGHEIRMTGCQFVVCQASTWTRVTAKELPEYIAKGRYDLAHYPYSKSRG